MIRTAKIIFCDNEHGVVRDMTYPDLHQESEELAQYFIVSLNTKEARKAAKKAGWSRHAGADYCPMCTDGGI